MSPEPKLKDTSMSILKVAENNVDTGLKLIMIGVNHGADAEFDGIGGLLGAITVCVRSGIDTKPKLVEEMRIAVPGLSKKFGKQLLDLLTGSDPQTHLLSKDPNGTYSIIVSKHQMDQSSPAGVQ